MMSGQTVFRRKLKTLATISVGGFCSFCGINIVMGNEKFYREWIMPAVHFLDPELTHRLGVQAARWKLFPRGRHKDSEQMRRKLWGLEFSNPLGLAAGFDKNGEAIEGMSRLGFGFVEIGTVTPRPQLGNDKPRVFRIVRDKAVINCYGFNNDGYDEVYERLKTVRASGKFSGIVGVNLGKNKTSEDPVADYVEGVRKFGEIADYLTINISSPNTPGLRNLHAKSELEVLLSSVLEERDALPSSKKPAVLLKLSPDLSESEKRDVAYVVMQKKYRIDGLIVSNTTTSRPAHLRNDDRELPGGLSGAPLKELSTSLIRDMHTLTKGEIPIIGVGGISTGADAVEKLQAGASLVQLYTALVYDGPVVVDKIKREMEELLNA